MSEYWPYLSFTLNLFFMVAVSIASWFIRDMLRKALTEKDIKAMQADIQDIGAKVKAMDEAIRGNGKVGLVERVGVLCTEVRDVMRRVDQLERDAA